MKNFIGGRPARTNNKYSGAIYTKLKWITARSIQPSGAVFTYETPEISFFFL